MALAWACGEDAKTPTGSSSDAGRSGGTGVSGYAGLSGGAGTGAADQAGSTSDAAGTDSGSGGSDTGSGGTSSGATGGTDSTSKGGTGGSSHGTGGSQTTAGGTTGSGGAVAAGGSGVLAAAGEGGGGEGGDGQPGGSGSSGASGAAGGTSIEPLSITNLAIDPNPNMTISCFVSWTTDVPASSEVDFGAGTYAFRIQDATLVTDHHVLVIGMHASTQYKIKALSSAGSKSGSAEGTFTTGALPADLPSTTLTVNNTAKSQGGWTLMNAHVNGDPAFIIMYDEDGVPVWYFLDG
ncbi:MAG TPA: hypothetical protein VMI54_10345, partial [Polyangiaceae bacterium]|nr:hypothetical protein [Polyangiaceae bacterium]